MNIKDIKLSGDYESRSGSTSEAGHIPMGCTHDSNGRELSYKDSAGYWWEYTRDSNGRVLSYKIQGFNGIRIADDDNYVLFYDNTGDTFLAGCSGILTRAQAIKRWDRDDDRALLYTLAIGITGA